GTEQDSQLGGSDFPEGQREPSPRVRCQSDLDQQQIVRGKKSKSDEWGHLPAENQPAGERRESNRVEHVIDVEAVARPLLAPHAGQGAVKTVAEPVERQKRDPE